MSNLESMPKLAEQPEERRSLVGAVFERRNPSIPTDPATFQPRSSSTNKGFPSVQHRSQYTVPGPQKKSAFARSREESKKPIPRSSNEVPDLVNHKNLLSASSETPSQRAADEWREKMSQENAAKVAAMTDDEREQEQREILERFGPGIGEILKKVRENRLNGPSESKEHTHVPSQYPKPDSADSLEEIPVSQEVPFTQVHNVLSRPSLALTESLSADNSRPSTPTRSTRKLRFAEVQPKDVHVYESAPPSPRKKSLLLLPPSGSDDAVSLGSLMKNPALAASPNLPTSTSIDAPGEGTPEDIRRRFFPSAPSNNPDLQWMMDVDPQTPIAALSSANVLRFDLSGRPVPPSLSLELPTHLGLHHHADGTRAGYTLDDIFLLVRSRVGAQRAAMLDILKGIVGLLRDNEPSKSQSEELLPLLDELTEKTPVVMKQIVFVSLEALSERGNVGSRAIELLWECTVGWDSGQNLGLAALERLEWEFGEIETRLPPDFKAEKASSFVPVVPLQDLLPELVKIIPSPPDFDLLSQPTSSVRAKQTPTQILLLSLLHHLARFSNSIADEICKTRGLISQIAGIYLISSSRTTVNALAFFTTIAQASRPNAKHLVDVGIADSALKFVVMGVGELESPKNINGAMESVAQSLRVLERCLRLYFTLARYGLFCRVIADVSEVWRRVDGVIQSLASGPDLSNSTSISARIRLLSTYLCLIEAWFVCATDPHRTTPPHALVWSQVSAWGWSDDVISLAMILRSQLVSADASEHGSRGISLLFSAVWRATTAWLQGSRINAVKNGEKERNDALVAFRDGFDKEDGVEAGVLKRAIDDLTHILHELKGNELVLPALEKAGRSADILTSAMRLWLGTLPLSSGKRLEAPPFSLPFSGLSGLCALLVGHTLWIRGAPSNASTLGASYERLLLRSLSTLLYTYLRLSRHLPGISRELWLTQAFAVLLRMQSGDEEMAMAVVREIAKMLDSEALHALGLGIGIPKEFWEKGGVQLVLSFLVDSIQGAPTNHLAINDDDEDDTENKQTKRFELVQISPMHPTPQTIISCSTLRLPALKLPDAEGLPLARDWTLSMALDRLLRTTTGSNTPGKEQEILVPSPWAASELDITRAALLLTWVGSRLLRRLKLGPSDAASIPDARLALSMEETVFGCMKVFMLEHGLSDSMEEKAEDGQEVFRDPTVSALMHDLLQPFTFGSEHSDSATSLNGAETLETTAQSFLRSDTPFYQFYTDFVTLYDSISFSDQLFARLLIPPISMRYPLDYRKLLWNDFGHVMKGIRVPVSQVLGSDIRDYLFPVEGDPEVLGAYLRALFQRGGGMEANSFVRLVAVHHVASNIWNNLPGSEEERAKKLLLAVIQQGSQDITKDVLRYRQATETCLLPPDCYSLNNDYEWRRERHDKIQSLCGNGISERVAGVFDLPS